VNPAESAAGAAEAPGPTQHASAGLNALYVYYRVDADRLPQVLAQVRAMHVQLALEFDGLDLALQRRPELRDGQLTLMETYAERRPGALSAGFERALAQHSAALPQPRHSEHFTRL
jgi:hypothetical protein